MKEIDQMWADLKSELATLDKEENTIKRLELSREFVWDAIFRLEDFFLNHNEFDDDPASLVNFNRNLAPPFYANFIFFSKISAFECLKVDMDPAEIEQLQELELASIKRFLGRHSEFRQYYLKGMTSRDTVYFQNVNNTIHFEDLVVGISSWVNKGCLLVAYMQAFEEYRNYLTTSTELSIAMDLKWTGKPSDLNELLIVLEGYIDKGDRKATIKEIMQAFGDFLHINLANSSQLDNKRRNRLHDEPKFLLELAEKSKRRKKKLDDDQDSRKPKG